MLIRKRPVFKAIIRRIVRPNCIRPRSLLNRVLDRLRSVEPDTPSDDEWAPISIDPCAGLGSGPVTLDGGSHDGAALTPFTPCQCSIGVLSPLGIHAILVEDYGADLDLDATGLTWFLRSSCVMRDGAT